MKIDEKGRICFQLHRTGLPQALSKKKKKTKIKRTYYPNDWRFLFLLLPPPFPFFLPLPQLPLSTINGIITINNRNGEKRIVTAQMTRRIVAVAERPTSLPFAMQTAEANQKEWDGTKARRRKREQKKREMGNRKKNKKNRAILTRQEKIRRLGFPTITHNNH